MGTAFVSYEHVPSGFEVIIADGEMCPGSSGGIWNLWWNVQLTDDPEAWDGEIELVNAMQDRLGRLTSDRRLIRAQMAEFCRLSPSFPHSVDILCEEIGIGQLSTPVRMGCEGRGLLDALGYHDAASLRKQRMAILSQYALALDEWLARGHPETPTESKVFGFLSQWTRDKAGFAERLAAALHSEELSISSLKQLSGGEAGKALSRSRPFNCLTCDGSREGPDDCLCSWAMIIDPGLLCAAASDEGDSSASWGDAFRRFTEEHILAYASAVNAWLEGDTPQPIVSLIDARYIGEDRGLTIAQRVHSALGAKDEVKEWLAACLLKTIKSNQRWHERVELIDSFPEATSWFTCRR
jgi:hypothetical protein